MSKGETYGIIGFIFSLLAIAGLFVDIIFGGFFGIVALILSIIQLKKKKTGLATAGLIISIIAILLGVISLIIWVFIANVIDNGSQSIENIATTLT